MIDINGLIYGETSGKAWSLLFTPTCLRGLADFPFILRPSRDECQKVSGFLHLSEGKGHEILFDDHPSLMMREARQSQT